jgi:hypothetical protein
MFFEGSVESRVFESNFWSSGGRETLHPNIQSQLHSTESIKTTHHNFQKSRSHNGFLQPKTKKLYKRNLMCELWEPTVESDLNFSKQTNSIKSVLNTNKVLNLWQNFEKFFYSKMHKKSKLNLLKFLSCFKKVIKWKISLQKLLYFFR